MIKNLNIWGIIGWSELEATIDSKLAALPAIAKAFDFKTGLLNPSYNYHQSAKFYTCL